VVRKSGDAASTTGLGRAFIEEIHQRTAEDVVVWENKAYLPRPALAHGDGPIMQFRRWCEQFYAEGVDRSGEVAVPEMPVEIDVRTGRDVDPEPSEGTLVDVGH
jgi:hypothetical protein